jgi:hypothetical protein
MKASAPLRKVLAVEIDWSMRYPYGFAALLWLECGHSLYTESRKHICESESAQKPPYISTVPGGFGATYNTWTGGRKRCPECLREESSSGRRH